MTERPCSDEHQFLFDAGTVSNLRESNIHSRMVAAVTDTYILETCTLSASDSLEEVPLETSAEKIPVAAHLSLNAKPPTRSNYLAITITKHPSTGKLLSSAGFTIAKNLLTSPQHKANMQQWVRFKNSKSYVQHMSQNFVEFIMDKDRLDQGGVETLRILTLSQVDQAEKAEMKLREMADSSLQPQTHEIEQCCSDVINLWINMWPLFMFWCHIHMILSKKIQKTQSSVPISANNSEHRRFKKMVVKIAELLERLELHIGDPICLRVRSKFCTGKYETYFGQDVEIQPRQVVFKLLCDSKGSEPLPQVKILDIPDCSTSQLFITRQVILQDEDQDIQDDISQFIKPRSVPEKTLLQQDFEIDEASMLFEANPAQTAN